MGSWLMMRYLCRLWKWLEGLDAERDGPEAGQSMVEYAILAALIAIIAMASVQGLGGGVAQVFANILARITGIGA